MNVQRRCLKCHEFFPVKPMELKFFCDKKDCHNKQDHYLKQLKKVVYREISSFF
jgi:hypothetical protein